MKMGIERVLKEKFGDAIKDIQQVDNELPTETTVEVSYHLSSTSVVIGCYLNLKRIKLLTPFYSYFTPHLAA